MDHAEATASQATERYLLDDLSAAEADAFEEHYFDCAECADDLRLGVQVMNGGRSLAREARAPSEAPVANAPVVSLAEHRARRASWIPAVAAAALVLAVTAPVILKQQRDARAPVFEVASQESFLNVESRGANDVRTIDGSRPNVLWVDVPSEPVYPRYEARIQQPDGAVLARPFTPDPEGKPTALTVRGLAAGPHELVIVGIDQGGQQTGITRQRFNVRR